MGRSHDIYTVFSFVDMSDAPAGALILISPQTAETEWEEEGGSQPIMSHSSYFSFCRPSPFLSSFFSVFLPVLRLRRKCAVSSCTSSMFSSLHVNTHPKCIIGTVLYLHAVQHTADGFVTPAKAYQSDTDVPVPPSTTVNYNPNPEPTGGNVAPSMDTNQPHPLHSLPVAV